MSRNLSHIVSALFTAPWAVEPRRAQALSRVVLRRASGERMSAFEIDDEIGSERDRINERLIAADRVNASRAGVAVVPILGTLIHRGSLDNSSGMTSTELIAAKLRAAANDAGVATILLDVDSPGGEVSGTPELAAQIAAIEKPVVAVANAWAASAAYWIATAADELVVTPSGEVGSIGVLILHQDDTKAMEAEGVTQSVISAGEFKAEMWGPLSEDAKAELQRRATAIYGDFVASVARSRGTTPAAVRDKFGRGRMVSAKEALDAGMVDRVATFQETLDRLLAGGKPRRRARAAADPRAELDLCERELEL